MRRAYSRPTTGQFTRALTRVPPEQWPEGYGRVMTNPPTEAWRSRDYLLMVYREGEYDRLSVVRTALTTHGAWADGIPWDDLQRLKRECGRGGMWAVEVYPPDCDVTNVANMRHLWLLPHQPAYGWHSSAAGEEVAQTAYRQFDAQTVARLNARDAQEARHEDTL